MNGAADTVVKNAGTDSRQAKPGDLFFAIRGEKFDGHDFIAEAIEGTSEASAPVSTMAEAIVRTGCSANRSGPCAAVGMSASDPATIDIAIASPMPREAASTMPATSPGVAAGICRRISALQRVIPRATPPLT